VALFVVLGGFVGENLKHVSPLKGYGINLAGSLLGMALFATLSFLDSGPAIWLLVGFILSDRFHRNAFAARLIPSFHLFDCGQSFVLSMGGRSLASLLKSHPEAKPNSFLFPQYELPYEIVPSPKNVLIFGAGILTARQTLPHMSMMLVHFSRKATRMCW